MTIDEWIKQEAWKQASNKAKDSAFMWGYLAGGLFVGFVAYTLHGIGAF